MDQHLFIYLYSFWIYVWFLFYYFNFIDFSPYLAFLLCIITDLYKIILIIKNRYYIIDNKLITISRLFFIINMHYIPFLLIDYDINLKNIYFNIFLGICYLTFLKINNIKIKDVYDLKNFKNKNFNEYIQLRFNNKYIYLISCILFLFILFKIVKK